MRSQYGGDGANLIVDGITTCLSRLVLARAELGVESDRHQRAHSTSGAMAMV
jgi:hypothetical protein